MSLDDIFETVHYAGSPLDRDEHGLPHVEDDEDNFRSRKYAERHDVEKTSNDDLLAKTSGLALEIGDRVEVDVAGIHWGEGQITERSTTDYGGSKLFPVFHVESDDGRETWMSAISLTKVN